MNEKPIECKELESLLPAYFEGELGAAEHRAAERHVAECERCGTLLRDVGAIVRDASGLPVLTPSRDMWPEIEARIQPDVLPLDAAREEKAMRTRRAASRWTTSRLAAAAAALVASTAGITYVATTHADSARTSVAAVPVNGNDAPDSEGTRSTALPAAGAVRYASSLSTEQLYDQEIAHLQTVVRDRRSLLDTATIAVIQRNLGIIDSAIAQSRAALAADPASRFLNDQLNSVLGQKVELLRTVALLPART